MSHKTPLLPPIKKKHRLNLEKANQRVLKNFAACHDAGNTSVLYKLASKRDADQDDFDKEVNFFQLTNSSLKILNYSM